MVSVGRENDVSQGTISYGASKDLILVCTVQLKQMIKSHFSGKVVSSISDVAFASAVADLGGFLRCHGTLLFVRMPKCHTY